MNSDEILGVIRKFVEARHGPVSQLTSATDLIDAGMIDSFGFIELVSVLEETFQVQLDFADLEPEQFTRMGSLVELILASGSAASRPIDD